MLTYEQALKRILQAIPRPRHASVPLQEALGLVLARPMIAAGDLPAFDNAAVDGYAFAWNRPGKPHAAGRREAVFRIVGRAEAGRPFRGRVRAGQAVRIFTGAMMPAGAQAVVMQEHVVRRGAQLLVPQLPAAGQHIRRQGEDVCRGAAVLRAGTRLRAQELGILAALGCRTVPVFTRPTVALVAAGNELQQPGQRLRAGHIYDSNSTLLQALVQETGAIARPLGAARDTLLLLMRKAQRGLRADVLLLCGGVSVGEKDCSRTALMRSGVKPVFWKVNIKPGMPLFFGTHGRTLAFGLPGNPISAYVTFQEFVRPVLCRLLGRPWQDPYRNPAVLVSDLRVSPTRRTHFIRVRCSTHNQLVAEPLNGQGAHHFQSLLAADGWLRMTANGRTSWSAGTQVLVKRGAEGS